VTGSSIDAQRAAQFRNGLNETGYVEGQNVAVEYHWLDGQYDRLPSLMADLVRRRVAVIATPGSNPASLAAKTATTTIPIVNVTRDTGSRTHPWTSNTIPQRQHQQRDRGGLGHPLARPGRRSVRCRRRVLPQQARPTCDAHGPPCVPSIYSLRSYVEVGGLMSYGTDDLDRFRQAGIYTGQILKGAKPADLPVTQSTKFEFVINLVTARALGLEVPPGLSARADEVIE
jgi:putative ABC transport system substrate-binding protein